MAAEEEAAAVRLRDDRGVEALPGGAAAAPAAPAAFGANVGEQARRPEGSEEDRDVDDDEQVVTIRWAKHNAKCLDISHQRLFGDAAEPVLQLWHCPEHPWDRDRFIIPSGGHSGLVRPERFPSMCLSSPDGALLRFESCNLLADGQKLFTISQGVLAGRHHIHFAAAPLKCLDIPNNDQEDGNRLMLWDCQPEGGDRFNGVDYFGSPGVTPADRVGDERLLIEPAPTDCRWTPWSDWTPCSAVCGEAPRRERSRAVATPALDGGRPCDEKWLEVSECLGDVEVVECSSAAEDFLRRFWPFALALALLCCCLVLPVAIEVRRRRRRRRLAEEEDEEAVKLLVCEKETPVSSRESKTIICAAGHELELAPAHCKQRWICNASRTSRGCRAGASRLSEHTGLERMRCSICDYDLCIECYTARLRDPCLCSLGETVAPSASRWQRASISDIASAASESADGDRGGGRGRGAWTRAKSPSSPRARSSSPPGGAGRSR